MSGYADIDTLAEWRKRTQEAIDCPDCEGGDHMGTKTALAAIDAALSRVRELAEAAGRVTSRYETGYIPDDIYDLMAALRAVREGTGE